MARKVVKIIFLILIFQFTPILPSYAENTYIQSINTTAVTLPNGDMNVTQTLSAKTVANGSYL